MRRPDREARVSLWIDFVHFLTFSQRSCLFRTVSYDGKHLRIIRKMNEKRTSEIPIRYRQVGVK